MVQIAKSTIGTPYKWGGNSPQRGFDCSGLMTYVHRNAVGLKIPRTAAKQRDNSRTINYAQLQPGDMLFFKTGKKTNHVGVYIGNRKFIHAPSGGKRVKVASMDSSYWFKRFVKFGTYL
jgi:cell wall-associated NlpC family hydrolase